jgi:hypothetical protein
LRPIRSHPNRIFQVLRFVTIAFVINLLPFHSALADSPQPANSGSATSVPATPCQAGAVCFGAERLQVDPIWWNENKLNQINADTYTLASQLLSDPYNTCGPASLAMVMNFLNHLKKPDGKEQYAIVDVMHVADQLGYYKPPNNDGSLGVSDLSDIAAQFGFKQAYPKDGGSFLTYTDFLQRMKDGYPAIVGMRFGYDKTTGIYQPTTDPIPWNHYAIIFGYTDDGQFLWMLNPHPGIGLVQNTDVRLQLIRPDALRSSWTKNDGSEVTDYGEALFLK